MSRRSLASAVMWQPGPRIKRAIGRLPWVLAFFALLQPVATLFARWDWRADLLTHFQEPALVASLVASAALVRRHRTNACVFLALAFAQAFPLVRYSWPFSTPRVAANVRPLRILMANVLVDNDRYKEVADTIERERPDVVGFVEFSDEWAWGMAPFGKDYPFRYESPDGPRGLALWFREKPLKVDPPGRPTEDGWPYLHAVIAFQGQERHLWLVHPSSPFRRAGHHPGFPELHELGEIVGRQSGSRLVFGDLNTTESSPHFSDFVRISRLRDSRFGFGRQPSWPSWSPYRIPIDHAFISDDLAVTRREVVPPEGSDHFALVFEVAPVASAASATEAQAAKSSP